MSDIIWLASYPKSGNTWMRLLLATLQAGGRLPDINALEGTSASARELFDRHLLMESALLSADEIEAMRPAVHAQEARRFSQERRGQGACPTRVSKVHDAYLCAADGRPLLAGAEGACGAVLIVRDPRDIVMSLAHHRGIDADSSIRALNSPTFTLADRPWQPGAQLPQRLGTWSSHTASWLDQKDIALHVVRYEDLHAHPLQMLAAVVSFLGWTVSPELLGQAIDATRFSELLSREQQSGFREWTRPGSELGFFRHGISGGWRQELSAGQVASIEAHHGDMMARLGYLL